MKQKKKLGFGVKINKMQKQKQSDNPFEMHVNRSKFQVLGRKMKHDRGLPGLARAKSIKKRKETLLLEYKVKDKANKFLDRRIGENNSDMTKEDRIVARFAAERLKSHKRKAMFNLGDDEVLTHKGRSLAEIENFENPSSDDDDINDGYSKGKLDANFVEEAHFGGGLLKKTDESKERATVIEQLIAESKKRKAEKQQAKEKTLEKTEQLDVEWRELMPIVSGSGNNGSHINSDPVQKKDPYDLLMNQLRFEARGTPCDRLKSESELAAEEASKLREMEEDRLRRMRGEEIETTTNKEKRQHRSADDLDDGFQLDDVEEEFQLMYDKEGKLINNFSNDKARREKQSTSKEMDDGLEEAKSDEEEVEESNDEDEQVELNENTDDVEGSSDSDGEGEGIYDLSDMKDADNRDSSEEEEEEVDGCDVFQEQKDSGETKKSDENESNKEKTLGEKELNISKEKKKVAFDPVIKTIEMTNAVRKQRSEELQKEEMEIMEKAKLELPFTFEIPELYTKLLELLEDKRIDEQSIIIERMIKCNHPSLREKNKGELNRLFAFLLQFLNDADHLECWKRLELLSPSFFELTKFSPSNAAYCLSEILLEKHNEYQVKKHRYPSYETLVFLKLIPQLFPASDKRHPITTPALDFITDMLHQCQVTTRRAITTGLFLVTLFTQYVTLSKRILPEAFNFLCGIIHMATPVSNNGLIVPPFHRDHKFLYLQKPCLDLDDGSLFMLSSDLAPKSMKIDDEFRVRTVSTALNLAGILIELWKETSGIWLVFAPIMDHLTTLELNKYPKIIGTNVESLKNTLTSIRNAGFKQIIRLEKKPKALRLYDPTIRPVYEHRKAKITGDKSEHKKILTKYKREMKGALREIRRDRSFLANEKFKEIAKSDAIRIKKVKDIYRWGTQQQAELNKLDRQKRRKK